MIKSGASASAAASGGRNESSSSSIKSGRGGEKGRSTAGVKERGNMEGLESKGSSERRLGTQLSSTERLLRSSSNESVNVATRLRNESSSTSIKSGRGGEIVKSTVGLKERVNMEGVESQVSSERRSGTQMSSTERLLRSSSNDLVNVAPRLGRPPKSPGFYSTIEMENTPINDGEGWEGFTGGSKFRKGSKRSRIGNEDLLSDNEENEDGKMYGIEELLQQLDSQIEEKQVIELQSASRNISNKDEVERSYLDVVLKGRAKNIVEGRQLPITTILDTVLHAPAEKILIYKAEVKGGMATRAKQEEFRCDLKETLGDELMEEVSAVRPTRFGGYTIIFSSEEGREKTLNVIKSNEADRGIEERNMCIIAPKKKKTKFVCREIPEDVSPELILKEMYEKHNPLLQRIPLERREAQIFITRLGWIVKVLVAEAIAIYTQNSRIRFGMGREIKTEEFILLQQCYKCCNLGHNAHECRTESEWCRLCGRKGHSGKECPVKDDKSKWRCANCLWKNENKGMKLDVKHGAAQLHKCAVALQQKEIKKTQLASSGVFTSPIDVNRRDMDIYKKSENDGQILAEERRVGQRGQGQGANTRRKTRSKSIRRQMGGNQSIGNSAIGLALSSSSSLRQLFSNVNMNSQFGRIIRPIPTSNWQTVGRYSEGSVSDIRGRGRELLRGEIGSSHVEMSYAGDVIMDKPSQNIAYYQHE